MAASVAKRRVGARVRGREAKGLEVFNEGVEYWGRLQQEGRIESFEVVLLYPPWR